MAYIVGPKGQIVVAKEIRDKLGIEPGWRALQRVEDDHVVIHFLPPSHNRSLAGSLAPYISEEVKKKVANMDWQEIREAAWEAAAWERAARMAEQQ